MRFALKHAVATAVVVAGIIGFTAASYFALLLWAALAGRGLGGPLALPFMLLGALLASVVAVLFILLPSTALTEWLGVKFRLRLLLQIPVATGVLIANVFAGSLLMAQLRNGSFSNALWAAAIVSGLLLIPLGAYWWSLQTADWLLRLATRIREQRRTSFQSHEA